MLYLFQRVCSIFKSCYEWDEFPIFHIQGVSLSELLLLKDIWYAHPEIWENRDQPDWDLLFDLAGL